MRSVPPVVVDSDPTKPSASFRCSESDLVCLAVVAGKNRQGLKHLFRCSPAVFIFALANHREQKGRAPKSFKELVDWADKRLLGCFANRSPGWSCGSNGHVDEAAWKRVAQAYLRADSNSDLRKALRKFVQSHCLLKKAAAKQWIQKIVGKRLKLKRCDVNPNLSANGTAEHSNLHLLDNLNVESFFAFRKSCESNRRQFADRLATEKLAAMKQLAYGASHEINNPLANISTRAQTLMQGEADPERLHKLAVIYEQALRAHEMISDLMLFAHPPEINPVSTDIRLMMSRINHEILTELSGGRETASQPGDQIKLQFFIGPEVSTAMVDPDHVCVALKALLRNSIESVRCRDVEGRINVRVFHFSPQQLGFEITDNGVGVSPKTRQHLFDPFFSGREAGRGLGFGLSKAWRIARMHGGDVRFMEHHYPGAKFLMIIPANQIERAAR